MKMLTKITSIALITLPVLAFAATPLVTTNSLISQLRGMVNGTIALLVGIALVVFFWGLVKFIFRIGGDEKAVEEGKKLMIWGVIALFVMISVWGIIRLIQGELLPGSDFNPPSYRPYI